MMESANKPTNFKTDLNQYRDIFERELLGQPTDVMRQYLTRFEADARKVIDELTKATNVWTQYQAMVVKLETQRKDLTWSGAYFLNAINSTLVSTRLFLSGYIVPSGNQARCALESMAFGILLAFPETGTFKEWQKGHDIEYKALERLARHVDKRGVNKNDTESIKEHAKWFDRYSHASRSSLAAIWQQSLGGWCVGAMFVQEDMPQNQAEMAHRISMAQLQSNAIAGTYAKLVERKIVERPTWMTPDEIEAGGTELQRGSI